MIPHNPHAANLINTALAAEIAAREHLDPYDPQNLDPLEREIAARSGCTLVTARSVLTAWILRNRIPPWPKRKAG